MAERPAGWSLRNRRRRPAAGADMGGPLDWARDKAEEATLPARSTVLVVGLVVGAVLGYLASGD